MQRAAMAWRSDRDSPIATDAMAKAARPKTKRGLRPRLSATIPHRGEQMAGVSVKGVSSGGNDIQKGMCTHLP
jgi:hypothetical protein